jgi:hypothetical protein
MQTRDRHTAANIGKTRQQSNSGGRSKGITLRGAAEYITDKLTDPDFDKSQLDRELRTALSDAAIALAILLYPDQTAESVDMDRFKDVINGVIGDAPIQQRNAA